MMQQTSYGYSVVLGLDFKSAVEKVNSVLKGQGFGVLTTIDVQAQMKEKLGKEMEPYLILGVCNPSLASKALDAETEVGLLLPCNVIVYVRNGQSHVAVQRPKAMMALLSNVRLTEVAEEAEAKLKALLENLS